MDARDDSKLPFFSVGPWSKFEDEKEVGEGWFGYFLDLHYFQVVSGEGRNMGQRMMKFNSKAATGRA